MISNSTNDDYYGCGTSIAPSLSQLSSFSSSSSSSLGDDGEDAVNRRKMMGEDETKNLHQTMSTLPTILDEDDGSLFSISIQEENYSFSGCSGTADNEQKEESVSSCSWTTSDFHSNSAAGSSLTTASSWATNTNGRSKKKNSDDGTSAARSNDDSKQDENKRIAENDNDNHSGTGNMLCVSLCNSTITSDGEFSDGVISTGSLLSTVQRLQTMLDRAQSTKLELSRQLAETKTSSSNSSSSSSSSSSSKSSHDDDDQRRRREMTVEKKTTTITHSMNSSNTEQMENGSAAGNSTGSESGDSCLTPPDTANMDVDGVPGPSPGPGPLARRPNLNRYDSSSNKKTKSKFSFFCRPIIGASCKNITATIGGRTNSKATRTTKRAAGTGTDNNDDHNDLVHLRKINADLRSTISALESSLTKKEKKLAVVDQSLQKYRGRVRELNIENNNLAETTARVEVRYMNKMHQMQADFEGRLKKREERIRYLSWQLSALGFHWEEEEDEQQQQQQHKQCVLQIC